MKTIQMSLIKNQTYHVVGSPGMILKGKFVGIMTQGSEKTLIFQNQNERSLSPNDYFGASWQLDTSDAINPSVYLQSTHYGNSTESLVAVNQSNAKREIVLFGDKEK